MTTATTHHGAPHTVRADDWKALGNRSILLCTETGRVRMQQWIKELLGHRERLEPFLDALVSRGEDTLLERERELLPELERLCWARVPRSRAIARHAELLETARRLMRELAPDSELLPLVEGLLALRDCRTDEADTAREIGLGVGRLLCNPKGAKSGFKRPIKTAGLDAVPVLADLNDALVAIARDVWRSVRAAREGFHDEHERLAIRRARAIAHLVRSVFARYDALKAREGVLDFDDLERHARALLADDGPVIERYAHVLMDEFQDTNRLQWELVKRVAPADPQATIQELG